MRWLERILGGGETMLSPEVRRAFHDVGDGAAKVHAISRLRKDATAEVMIELLDQFEAKKKANGHHK